MQKKRATTDQIISDLQEQVSQLKRELATKTEFVRTKDIELDKSNVVDCKPANLAERVRSFNDDAKRKEIDERNQAIGFTGNNRTQYVGPRKVSPK